MRFDYNSKRWHLLRQRVLKRDGYLCRESLRMGKRVAAQTVHHIYPAAIYPQLAYSEWNLVSLSLAEHNEMHIKNTQQLTAKGKAWQRRVYNDFVAAGVTPPPSR